MRFGRRNAGVSRSVLSSDLRIMPPGHSTTSTLEGAAKSPTQVLPEGVIQAFRFGRNLGYYLLSPFDFLSRLINGKRDFPPLHLRRYVGAARTFEISGAEFLAYLRLLADLQPGERVLDLGCGCGLMALFLRDYLQPSAQYVGVDVYKPAVRWCTRHLEARNPNFRFVHADIRNQAYNPTGSVSATEYTLPVGDQSFDVVLLKSVFTHLRPAETTNYLKEIRRVLAPGGRCLGTFFLLNRRQEELAAEGRSTLKLNFGPGAWRYVHRECPESAIAYDESYLMDEMAKHGLRLRRPIAYGSWSGREDGLSYQDILIMERS